MDHTRDGVFSLIREMQNGWYRIGAMRHFDPVSGMRSRAQCPAVCLDLQAKRLVLGFRGAEMEVLGEMSAQGCSDAEFVAGGLRFGILSQGIEGSRTTHPVIPPIGPFRDLGPSSQHLGKRNTVGCVAQAGGSEKLGDRRNSIYGSHSTTPLFEYFDTKIVMNHVGKQWAALSASPDKP
jgi:hypothetical protein